MRIDIDQLSSHRDKKIEEVLKNTADLEILRDQLSDLKIGKIDNLCDSVTGVVNVAAKDRRPENTLMKIKVAHGETTSSSPVASLKKEKKWALGIKGSIEKVKGTIHIRSKSIDSLRFHSPYVSQNVYPPVTESKKTIDKVERPYHKFLPHVYRSLLKCDFCNEKLWGKELRCEGFNLVLIV